MTPEEIIKVLREVDADAKASEGDYYADQFAWLGAGEVADAVEQMAAEIARLREERRCVWSDYDGSRDFETACGNRQSIDLDLDIYDFCPFCGGRVEEQNEEPPWPETREPNRE